MSGYLDKLRDHEFDGIQEFDNYLPRWWLWSFYLACIFAAIYWMYYHGTGFGLSSNEAYQVEFSKEVDRQMKAAASGKPITAELLTEYAKQPSAVAAGEKIFIGSCAACHRPDGSGLVGPNLTDNHWIHGGSIEQIYQIVSKGSPTNPAMVPWEPTLKRTGVMNVVAYVMTIKNTNRPGKEPEGKPEK